MEQISTSHGKKIVEDLIAAVQANKQHLSDIDGAIGDGDHGINMNKGFTLCTAKLSDDQPDLSTSLKTLGQTLMGDIGGSMGPLYGSFFRAMAKACQGRDTIDAALFGDMLAAAREKIGAISEAQVGDKTLIDTLQPALEAYRASTDQGNGFAESLDAMTQAARDGRDSTRQLVAKLGRASRLGERSRGTIDPGAASCCLILETFAASIKELLDQ